MVPLYLHIGYPKTGTTTLQAHLFAKHPQIDYLGKYIPGLGYETQEIGHLINHIISANGMRLDTGACRSLKAILDERRHNSQAKSIVISTESFLHVAGTDFNILVDRILEAFAPCRIMVSIREQFDLLLSFYRTHGKYGQYVFVHKEQSEELSFPINLDRWLDINMRTIDRNIPGILYYGEVDKILQSKFGDKDFDFFLYEDMRDDFQNYVGSLSRFLGIDADTSWDLLRGRHENPSAVPGGQTLDGRGEARLYLSPILADARHVASDASIRLDPGRMTEIRALYADSNRRLARHGHLALQRYGYAL